MSPRTDVRVRKATAADRDAVVETITRAFAGDRIIRWLMPNDATYPDEGAAFFGYMFDIRIDGGEIYVTDDLAGAALWNPPGGNRHDEAFLDELWERDVVPHVDAGAMERYTRFAHDLQSMTPARPHWYLGVLGTLPERQRAGIAQAVVAPVLALADRDGTPSFLETGMPDNVEIYRRRFGFEVIAEADVPDGPHVWGMLREPR